MLEINPKILKGIHIIGEQNRLQTCPIKYEKQYIQLVQDIKWEVGHELEIEEYYLSEQDYPRYADREYNQRLARINELRARTPQQIDREIHARVMSEIFKGTVSELPKQGEVFNASKNSQAIKAA